MFGARIAACAHAEFSRHRPAKLRTITIDASSNLGEMKPLRGVNSGPLPWSDRPAVETLDSEAEVFDCTGCRSLGADASAGHREANIDLICIYDNYGPGDIYANFRNDRQLADNNDGFDLRVNGPQPEKRYEAERYRISDVWDYRLQSTVILKGSEVKIAQPTTLRLCKSRMRAR